MEEYEYSFKVEDLKPYIDYCEINGYLKLSVVEQNRVVYENKNNKNEIARITTTKVGDTFETIFDYKTINTSDKELKISRETEPIIITDENKKGILSKLETEGFSIVADNTRTRYVYKKDSITFELDDYSSPKMKVVAIEGEKLLVDKVYNEIKKGMSIVN